MKKYLSIFLILFAVMATETGCESNNPEETKRGGTNAELNQPADPETWSPAGKTYVYEYTTEADFEELREFGYDGDYYIHVVRFLDEKHFEYYLTPNKDLSVPRQWRNFFEGEYRGEYPMFILKDERLFFSDVNTCYFSYNELQKHTLLEQ